MIIGDIIVYGLFVYFFWSFSKEVNRDIFKDD